MKHKLPNNIASNNIFIINRSELDGRFEPEFYSLENRLLLEKLKRKKHYKLKEIVSFSSESWNQKDYFKTTFPYIEISEINLITGEVEEIKEVLISEAPSRAKMIIRKGDIIISTTRPTRGAISYFDNIDEIKIASTGFAVIRKVKEDVFYREALFYILRLPFSLQQMGQRSSGGNYPAITQEELGNIIIPYISKDLQINIAKKFQSAYSSKKNKEQECASLLKQIDEYLLNHLGIKIPQLKTSLEHRIFVRKLSDITGNRFDPKLYDETTKGLREAITKTQLPIEKLKKLVSHSVAGDWGKDEDENVVGAYVKCLVIRATEFDNTGNLNLDNSRVKYRLINAEKLKKIDIQVNDLLIEKSGGSPDQPVGRIALITEEYIKNNQLCFSNFIHKIRVDSTLINPEYLFYFLKMIHNIKLTDAMQSQTNGIRNLIMRDYFDQNIIIPPMNKQLEIVDYIKKSQQKIRALQAEANSIIENTKLEVEKMIIG